VVICIIPKKDEATLHCSNFVHFVSGAVLVLVPFLTAAVAYHHRPHIRRSLSLKQVHLDCFPEKRSNACCLGLQSFHVFNFSLILTWVSRHARHFHPDLSSIRRSRRHSNFTVGQACATKTGSTDQHAALSPCASSVHLNLPGQSLQRSANYSNRREIHRP